jgi:hypothetical protein
LGMRKAKKRTKKEKFGAKKEKKISAKSDA